MAMYDFDVMLQYSLGVREETDAETIKALIPGCVNVEKTAQEIDKTGVDFVATLRNGAEILVDAKTRTPGCSRYWMTGPELALELWSVKPQNGQKGKAGWTVCEAKNVDYVLFTFHPSDTDQVFLYPFQLLRIAFRNNYFAWRRMGYKTGTQSSGSWQSECIFVPETVVWDSVRECMQGVYADSVAA